MASPVTVPHAAEEPHPRNPVCGKPSYEIRDNRRVHPFEPLLVVVTGPPGAGKTTIAESLREELGLPLVAKDALKEALGGELGVTGRDASQRLGGAVYEVLGLVVHELLRAGVSVIAEGNFTAETRFLHDLPPSRVVQVHVTAAPDVLRRRMLERDSARHPVHHDRETADELAARTARGEWAPLRLDGETISIDTSERFPAVAVMLRQCLSEKI